MSVSGLWEYQRAFLAVLENGSLSAAARMLGVAQPTVRQRIVALEEALSTRLFTRSVNGLVPTGEALQLGAHVRAMAFASDAFVRAASSRAAEIAGTVRISTSEFFGVELLPPMLASLRARHPMLAIELATSNSSVDLLSQECDIAVRNFRPTQDGLFARLAGTMPFGFFASTDYLAQREEPATLADLTSYDLVGPDRAGTDIELAAAIHPALTPSAMAIRTDSHPAQLAAMRAGLGIGLLPRAVGHAYGLRLILPDVALPALPYWIAAHEDLRKLPRIRAVVDHLAEQIAAYAKDRGEPPPP